MADENEVDDELVAGPDGSDDVADHPGAGADSPADIEKYISADVRALYEVYSYKHAAAVLATSFPDELSQIEAALLGFKLTTQIIGSPGGNESQIPKIVNKFLRPYGWQEARIQGDLVVRMQRYAEEVNGAKTRKIKLPADPPRVLPNFVDGHKIDYIKGRVAFDLEWNSKDQTFDRDLYAMRAFHEVGLTSVGVMLTRAASLNEVFERTPQLRRDGSIEKPTVRAKYGASTTWMGKLLYRLNAGRHGGCPILAFGITPKVVTDWNP
jgi:CRISPR-associated protein Csd2